MAIALRSFRAAVAVTFGVIGTGVAVILGNVLAVSPLAWDWLVLPTTPAPFSERPVAAVILLDLVKVGWVLVSVAAVVSRLRESRRRASHVALIIWMANVSVQLLKHWPGGPTVVVAGLEPLSGHAVLVGAVALAWVVTAPRHERRRAAYIASASIVLTCLAAILLGLHSAIQVVCPLVICLGWSLALIIIEGGSLRPAEGSLKLGRGFTIVGVVLVFFSLVLPTLWPTTLGSPRIGIGVVLVVIFFTGSALCVVGIAVTVANFKPDLLTDQALPRASRRNYFGHRRRGEPRF